MTPGEMWLLSVGGQGLAHCRVVASDHSGHVQVEVTWFEPDELSPIRQIMAELAGAVEDLAFGVMEDCELRLEMQGVSLRRDERWLKLGADWSGLVWQPQISLLSFRLLVSEARER